MTAPITASDIQNVYIRLYKQLRKFTWPVSTVTAIADLEVEAYKAFPDKDDLVKYFTILQSMVSGAFRQDGGDRLKDAVEAFRSTITEYEEVFAPLNLATEVVSV